MQYQAVITELSQLVYRRGIHYDLSHFSQFLQALGNPHLKLAPIIHVAGTNGKGSTVHLVASGLKASGNRVGTYTSPHLVSYTERIQVNFQPISQAEFVRLFLIVQPFISQFHITEFEVLTGMMFVYFASQKLDYICLEVGLGGRLDATNVIIPNVSVITKIGYDHQAILGDTLDLIAREKAGVIKSNCPVFTVSQSSIVIDELKKIANANQAFLSIIDTDSLHFGDENIALARAVLHHLGVAEKHIQQGIQSVKINARFQVVSNTNQTIVLDVAHNMLGVQSLIQRLRDAYPGVRFTVLMGVLNTKDYQNMFLQLSQYTDCVYFCEFQDHDIVSFDQAKKLFSGDLILYDVSSSQLPLDSHLVITGSHYFIGRLLQYQPQLMDNKG